ncbi:C-C motif chemokine 27a [Boleophthalmus pectinirostris]|uniref:C-C motif chemokine 27a n=1 Tax=Boleophthalmus pectinirostris TaxID=150288 RepID=UPI002432ABF0|nr:C-C motif chemokine 27a [Boleophthalmus pectinirostris]
MDLKVVFLGVCFCAFAVTYSEAGIPRCCMSTRSDIAPRVLFNVQRWEIQHSSGACDISALILYVKRHQRPICADPKLKSTLMKIQSRRKRSHRKDKV